MSDRHPPSRPALLIRRLATAALAAALLQVAAVHAAPAGAADQFARRYAGLDQAAAAAVKIAASDNSYGASIDASWKAYQKRIGEPLREWSKTEVRHAGGGTVFYPFSGPDFVTVAQMYPNADRYVLVAIQGAGQPVELDLLPDAQVKAFEQKLSAEWKKFGQLGFFLTNDLDRSLRDRKARLTPTPVLMAFAARLGYQVVDVVPIGLDAASGDFAPIAPTEKNAWNSVRLSLKRGGKAATVDYVRIDLSDQYLKTHAAEAAWINKVARNPVLLKAASHLPQKPYFSVVREAIVTGAPIVVQDETGIEYKELTRVGEVTLYGRFQRPNGLFSQSWQRSLAAAYQAAGTTKPLPFSFSYQSRPDRRSLQIARRGGKS